MLRSSSYAQSVMWVDFQSLMYTFIGVLLYNETFLYIGLEENIYIYLDKIDFEETYIYIYILVDIVIPAVSFVNPSWTILFNSF